MSTRPGSAPGAWPSRAPRTILSRLRGPPRIASSPELSTDFGWFGTPGLTVTYYYQDLPSTKWIRAGTAKTNASGVFTSTLTAKAGQLRWKVVVTRQTLNGNVYLTTTSSAKDTEIKG